MTIASRAATSEGRQFTEALGWWRDLLAAGVPWSAVESDILARCRGRVDVVTRLLIEAETLGAP